MQVELLYFDGCPNWREAKRRVRAAIAAVGAPAGVLTLHRVGTVEEAERLGFRGSPTVLVNGVDPFTDSSAPVGLACRVYRTPDGLAGAPPLEGLTAALRAAR